MIVPDGILCPSCGSDENRVVDTRDIVGGIRRRRSCLDCGKRFNTFEYTEDDDRALRQQQFKLIHATVDAQYVIREAIEKLQQIKI